MFKGILFLITFKTPTQTHCCLCLFINIHTIHENSRHITIQNNDQNDFLRQDKMNIHISNFPIYKW